MFKPWHALVLASVLLGGCGWTERWDAADVRFTRAMPPGDEVLLSQRRLMEAASADPAWRKQVESAYQRQLAARAAACAPNPPASWRDASEDIRKRVAPACARAKDKDLQRWIGLQRVRWQLAQPALRPVPASAPNFIVAKQRISSVEFAEQAGIALLRTDRRELVGVDLAQGTELSREPHESALRVQALSDNGRVFVAPEARQAWTQIRSVETGETLTEIEGVLLFYWLGRDAALIHQRNKPGWFLLDLVSGEQQEVPGLVSGIADVRAVPGQPGLHVLFGRSLQQVALRRQDSGVSLQVLKEVATPVTEWRPLMGGVAGNLYLDPSGDAITSVELDSLQVRQVSVAPARAFRVQPTGKADEWLVTLMGPARGWGGQKLLVYNRQDGSMAPVISPPQQGYGEQRFLWVPALKQLGRLMDNRIELLAELPLGPRQALDAVVSAIVGEENDRRLASAEAEAQRAALDRPLGAWSPQPLPITPAPAPGASGRRDTLAELARWARIEGIGVQKAAPDPSKSSKLRQPNDLVRVSVRAGSRPLVLVLAAQEPVRWLLLPDPGARVEAVLLSGHPNASVAGMPVSRLQVLGPAAPTASDGPGFDKLQDDVRLVTGGRALQSFQYRREGVAFVVGQ